MAQPVLYLMLGFPGAGKTTAAEKLTEITQAVHLSSDRFRLSMFPQPQFTPQEHAAVYGALDYLTELLLSKGVSVIYDANLNHYRHREEKYVICLKTGASAVVLWVKTDKTIAKQRATVLGDHDPKRPYGNLNQAVFDRLAQEIEEPRENETVIPVDGTKITSEYITTLLKQHQIQPLQSQ